MTGTHDKPQSRWRIWHWRPRFSLRTFVVVLVVLGIGLGVLSSNLRRTWRQRHAVAELRECGVGAIFYRYDGSESEIEAADRPWRVRLLQRDEKYGEWYGEELLTKDFFDDVTMVNASELERFGFIRATAPLPTAQGARFWRAISQLPELECLIVANDHIPPAEIRGLGQHAKLERLCLQSTRLDDEHLREIGRLTELRRLMFGGGYFAFLDDEQAGADSRATVSREGFEHLRLLPDLEMLDLFGTTADDNSVEPLSHLQHLTRLSLGNTSLGDDGLRKLTGLKKLTRIHLRATKVTAAGVRDFQAALPGCQVDHPATDPPAPANAPGAQAAMAGDSTD